MAWITDDISGIIGIVCICAFVGILLYFIALSGIGVNVWDYVTSGFGYIFSEHNATSLVTGGV